MSRTVLLLARSAIAAPPLREMERLRALVAALPGVARAEIAFSEQGTPSLRHALDALVTAGVAELTILPLMLPPEAAFQAWLTRTLAGQGLPALAAYPALAAAARRRHGGLFACRCARRARPAAVRHCEDRAGRLARAGASQPRAGLHGRALPSRGG